MAIWLAPLIYGGTGVAITGWLASWWYGEPENKASVADEMANQVLPSTWNIGKILALLAVGWLGMKLWQQGSAMLRRK